MRRLRPRSGGASFCLSYTPQIRLPQCMRRPDPISLEETFLLFLLVIPMGYYAVWWLLAMIAAA